MSFWTRFIEWCKRPGMIKKPGIIKNPAMMKTQGFNPIIGEIYMRTRGAQIGLAFIMGWITLMVPYFIIQASISPGGEELFWGYAFLGLGLLGSGILLKIKKWFKTIGMTLLQTGIVVTIIWFITLIQRESPLDLGLLNPFFGWGYTYLWAFFHHRMMYNIPIEWLTFPGIPILGLVFLALGLVRKEKTENKIKSRRNRGRAVKRFVEWCERPSTIKIRPFNLNPSIAVIGLIVVIDGLFVANGPILLGPLVDVSGNNPPTSMAAADLLPSKVIGEPLTSGSIYTETLYVFCYSTLTPDLIEDISSVKLQIEHTRAQYKGIVIHVFKAPSFKAPSLDAWAVLDILSGMAPELRADVDWYGEASSYFLKSDCSRLTLTKEDRSAFFWRSGAWIFGVDAENSIIRNEAAKDLIQHLKNLAS